MRKAVNVIKKAEEINQEVNSTDMIKDIGYLYEYNVEIQKQ